MVATDPSSRPKRKPRIRWPLVVLLVVLLIAGLLAARFWRSPPLDPEQPSTWPVGDDRAVLVARGLGKSCPRNNPWWLLNGTAWSEIGSWQQQGGEGEFPPEDHSDHVTLSKAGVLCARSGRDLSGLRKIGTGAEEAPNSALYLAVTPKQASCPAGANYETPQYCLSETPLPPAPDISP